MRTGRLEPTTPALAAAGGAETPALLTTMRMVRTAPMRPTGGTPPPDFGLGALSATREMATFEESMRIRTSLTVARK